MKKRDHPGREPAAGAGAAKVKLSYASALAHTPTASPDPKKFRKDKKDDMPSENEMLRDVWLRMPTIDKISNQLDSLCSRMDTMELKVKDLESQNKDLEEGVGHIETELQGIRKVLDTKASSMELKKVNEQIVDLVNRSKRNNIVIHNIPEGAEGDTPDCCGLVHSIIRDKLGILASMEIERAHRTPMARPSTQLHNAKGKPRPRPIHVRFLRYRDRESVLKKATQTKNLEVQEHRIFISDDTHKATREQHRRLVQKVKQMREEGKFAFIPWSVPRVIKYKDGGKDVPGPLKTLKDLDS